MKSFILGLLMIVIVAFYIYRQKIREGLSDQVFSSEQEKIYDILGKGDPDKTLVPQGKAGAVDFIQIANNLSTANNYMKTRDAKFETKKVQQTLPKNKLDGNIVGCRSLTKCSQLNNGDCGYCAFTNEFKYGGSGAPGADVCPSNAWTTNPSDCEEMREKLICKKVKSCGDLVGEAAEICAWCPTAGRAMPFKQAGNKKVPKYSDDACNNQGYGILDAKDCAKFLKDHPCLSTTAFSGPHTASCLSNLWKKAIGNDRRTIDWTAYVAGGRANYWNTIGMNKVHDDMMAWKRNTTSSDYKTAVKGYMFCYGTKPDPCSSQFTTKPVECLDELWEKGGGKSDGAGLPSKAGTYTSGQSAYKNTLGGYKYTLGGAKEACAKEGARLCKKSEIMDKDICSAGWTADGVRGYPMANGVKWYDTRNASSSLRYTKNYCGGRSNGWRTWSTDPNNKGSAHCCYEFNKDDPQSSIVRKTQDLASKATSGDNNQQAGYMKMVYGKNWTPPPPPKPGDFVQFDWKQGNVKAWHKGYVIKKYGNKCSIMWISYKGTSTINRYSLKNDAAGMKTQRYWFGWPGIPTGENLGPNQDAGGLVLDSHLKVITACNNAPSACAVNCMNILETVMGRFPTPQDCVVNNWDDWSDCTKKCGGGVQSRSRSVKYPAKDGGNPCPTLSQKRMCNQQACLPANYKGCSKDYNPWGGTGGDLNDFAGHLTKAQCAAEAVKRNFKYYGLQKAKIYDSKTCYCDGDYCRNQQKTNPNFDGCKEWDNPYYTNYLRKNNLPGVACDSSSWGGSWGCKSRKAVSQNVLTQNNVNSKGCFLGNKYGKYGVSSDCKNAGAQNIPYGAYQSNAIYVNENYNASPPLKWSAIYLGALGGRVKNMSTRAPSAVVSGGVASPDQYLWVVGTNNYPWRSNNMEGGYFEGSDYRVSKKISSFTKEFKNSGGNMKQITCGVGLDRITGSKNTTWIVTTDGSIWFSSDDGSKDWRNVDTPQSNKYGIKNLSVSGDGWIWCVTDKNDIYKMNKLGDNPWVKVKGSLTQISGGQKELWGVGTDGKVWKRPIDGSGSWTSGSGQKMQWISASNPKFVFGVNTKGMVYRCAKPYTGNWELQNSQSSGYYGGYTQIEGGNGVVWGLGTDGYVYKSAT